MRIDLSGLICESYDDIVALRDYKVNGESGYSEESPSKIIYNYLENGNGALVYTVPDSFESYLAEIPDASLRIYYSGYPIDSEDDAMTCLLSRLDGALDLKLSEFGYSEYTKLGVETDNFCIGGHDIMEEIKSHMGMYMYLVLEY